MVVAAVVVAALVAVGVVAARASEHTTVVTGPGQGAGPPPGPNVQVPSLTVDGGGGELSPWEAARTGVDDSQLIISFNPRSPLTCSHVERVDVASGADTVEIGLYLSDDLDPLCRPLTGLVAVQLPGSLAGRRVVDEGDPQADREVLDGSLLEVPHDSLGVLGLVQERLLVNNDRLNGWLQTYSIRNVGIMDIAQGSRRSEVLGAVGLGPAGPGEAPVALNATKPLRTSTLDVDGRSVTLVVYAVDLDGRPTWIAMLWDEHDTSFAIELSAPGVGADADQLADVVRSMHTS